jgi:alkylhydroperoxidase/carboxymuconolactone decarboxylase family protein YurZ
MYTFIIMGTKVDEYNECRRKMNERILSADNLVIKRIYNIDSQTYREGALSVKTKEKPGSLPSLVLRCDDCFRYHLLQCHENGVTEKEVFGVLAIANFIGGTIVIPHTRKAFEYWDDLNV